MSHILIGIFTLIIALFSPIISLFMPSDETPKEPEIATVTFDGITYKNHFIKGKFRTYCNMIDQVRIR